MNSALLGDLVEIKGGGTPRRDLPEYWGGSIPWATVKDFVATEIDSTQESVTERGVRESATNIIPAGNIIIPTRMALGKAAINLVDLAINQDLKALITIDPRIINRDYLFQFLLSKANYIESLGKGATVKGIRLEVLKELEVPLPPVEKQKRIAAILDKADAIRRKRRQAIQLADEFLRSVFLDMFGDPMVNPKCWSRIQLGDLITDGPQNGLYRPSKDYGSGTFILRIDSFYDGKIKGLDNLKRVKIDNQTINRYKLNINDIVINRVNSRKFLGKSALVERLSETTVYESNMMRFSANENLIKPKFLIDLLQKKYIRNQILNLSRDAVNQSSINQNDVRSLMILLPPIEHQIKYINIIKLVENYLAMQLTSSSYNMNLFKSLSQRAFRGEL